MLVIIPGVIIAIGCVCCLSRICKPGGCGYQKYLAIKGKIFFGVILLMVSTSYLPVAIKSGIGGRFNLNEEVKPNFPT